MEREELLRVVLDLTADAIVRFDRDLRYDYVNDRTVEIVGISRDDWLGRTQGELGYEPEEVAVREQRIRDVFASGEPATYVDQISNLEGDRWYETQLFPQRSGAHEVAHVVVVSRDVTERVVAEAALLHAAHHDPLTGLANRVALAEDLERALAAEAPSSTTAVLLVDLDHFKLVNDSLGHTVGDRFLVRAADRLRACVSVEDLVARHGGDEFVVVLHDVAGADAAVEAAERIVDAFRAPLLVDAADLSATVSVGVALSRRPDDPPAAGDLLREADIAMFVAKGAGRDGVAVFDQELHDAVHERFRIANELRWALDRGELAVWYQPEVDLGDGSILAVEALLRWHHPSGELYPAGRFIEVAAETGLIVEIGHWIIDEVYRQADRWRSHGLVVRMNLAPRQLADPELLGRLDRASAASGVAHGAVCVEITETALLADTAVVASNLAGLTERGVELAIDDFGTGYASLTYLQRYEVGLLKIDRSFVADVATDGRDRALAAAVVALARQLDIGVTAEGIEEREQEAVLVELGCTRGQGYLYRPAVPASEIDELLATPTPFAVR